jgi:hypothetical protein
MRWKEGRERLPPDGPFSATFSQECNIHLIHNWLFVERDARVPAKVPMMVMAGR